MLFYREQNLISITHGNSLKFVQDYWKFNNVDTFTLLHFSMIAKYLVYIFLLSLVIVII